MKINIINLYYFSLGETGKEYLDKINRLLQDIRSYLHEEGITLKISKADIGKYDAREFHLEEVGNLLFFQKEKNTPQSMKYFPEMYAEISVESEYLYDTNKLRKLIFLLSNIFEQFDHFDEKYIFIEYHSSVEKLKTKYDIYKLRHNFQNIHQLGRVYSVEIIGENLRSYLSNTENERSLSIMKQSSPEIYLSLIYFTYLIFSLQKNLGEINGELGRIETINIENDSLHGPLKLSQQRLLEQKILVENNLEKIVGVYERFLEIFRK